MKTPSLALLNSLGFITPAQKLLFAAAALKNALVSSPSGTISPAIPTIPAKPESPALPSQTPKAARPASVAVDGRNNAGFLFGELYLNSPAYPAGTPIPAIPAKPASGPVAAVPYSPATPAIPAIPVVVSPAIAAIKGWEEAISIKMQGTDVLVVVDLPYNTGMALIGAAVGVSEITPSALTIEKWLDVPASNTLGTDIIPEPLTLEQYFYKYAQSYLIERPVVGESIKTNRIVNGVLIPVKRFTLRLASTGYNINLDSLQLNKITRL